MEKEEYLNIFLNSFFLYHHERNNLLFDNLGVFLDLMYNYDSIVKDYAYNNDIIFDKNKLTKATIIENTNIIKSFCSKYKININVDKLINDGTIELLPVYHLKNSSSFHPTLRGINNYLGKNRHKNVEIYTNGLLLDSVILIHELSHYRNQPNNKRGQISDLLTESLAYTEEFIYLDYLENLGYKYEADQMKSFIAIYIFFNMIQRGYYLLRIYLLYNELGEVSKENYKLYYKEEDSYEDAVDKSYHLIKEDQDAIFEILWYTLASNLSIYMYECYKKDPSFINNIKLLNDSLNSKSLEECLKIINISGYTKESIKKVKESINNFVEELQTKEKILKLK